MLIGVLYLEFGLFDVLFCVWQVFGFFKKLVLFVGNGVFGGWFFVCLFLFDILIQFFYFKDF